MTLVALCSLKGSPGVTTAALALAAGWPAGQRPVLVECDPAGGDLLARFRLALSPGLVTLTAAARRTQRSTEIEEHTQRLPGGLPVVVGPAGAEQARAVLRQLANSRTDELRRAANDPGAVVVADCGRADPDSPALKIVNAADVLLLVARAHDDALSHVSARWDEVSHWAPPVCLLLVGDGHATRAIEQALSLDVLGRVPEDRRGAALLGGRSGPRRASARTPLAGAMARIAATVAAPSFGGKAIRGLPTRHAQAGAGAGPGVRLMAAAVRNAPAVPSGVQR
ncbi:MinD/ParA family ATP-binding protein [Streptomyces endophyticus]|uniref:Chromosome partitioning protein n=1 Tax=Streptomyces endophyticus TaxID=714166 RepID=A0ABU6F220_9ACTN|nr:hypothetical protein [Streptomyces endophyticus]MEB8338050.1 hypothetical protein [Streptomyces endophyticus]